MADAPATLDLPPLLSAVEVPKGGTVLQRAIDGAAAGRFEAGCFLYRINDERVSLALVLEPEVPAHRAAAMLHLGQVAVADAIASTAPPETTLGLRWTGDVLLNGALAATLSAAMAGGRDDETPAWLAVAAIMRFSSGQDGGLDPARTTLRDELGPNAEPGRLLESIGRHWLLWLHRWETEGLAPVARHWSGRAVEVGKDVEAGAHRGRFMGIDEEAGALLATKDGMRTIPALSLWQREEARA